MNVLNAARTNAGMKQWPFWHALRSAHPAYICSLRGVVHIIHLAVADGILFYKSKIK